MEKKTFSAGDYGVFGGLLLGSTLVGVYYAWKDRKAKDSQAIVSLKDAKMGLVPVAISLMASYISAITILAIPGEMYTHGTQFWFASIGIIIAMTLTNLVYLPVLYHMDITTINEYYLQRYGSEALRSVCSVAVIFGAMFYLGAVLFGPSLAISSVTDLNVWLSVVTIGLVCTFYTTIGGLKAVIWTDVIQMVIMLVGLIVVVAKVSSDVGGLPNIFRIAREGGRIIFNKTQVDVITPAPTLWDSILQPTIGWTAALVASQTGFQRICGMPTYTKARILTLLNIPGVITMTTLSCLSGVAIYARYFDCDPLSTGAIEKPDQLMPYYVMNAFDHLPGLPGLFVACVFSASLSSISSALNASAAITWGDFLKKYVKVDGRKEVLIMKGIAVVYGLIAIGVAFLSSNVSSILQAAAMLSGPLNGALLSVLTLGILCPFVNHKGALAGMIISMIFTFWSGVGGALISRPQDLLPGRTDGCPGNFTLSFANETVIEEPFTIPGGIKIMQYLSPYFVGSCSFFLCTIISIVVSLITGGARGQRVPSNLVHPSIFRLSKWAQTEKHYPLFYPTFITKESGSTDTILDDLQEKKPEVKSDTEKPRF